ncbi:MAG: molecular chaperone TorD family protein [Sulfolobaceae archaeon]
MKEEEIAFSNLFGAFSLILSKEIDESLLIKLQPLQESLKSLGVDFEGLNLRELRAEYTEIFIINVPPYESVFLGENNRFMDFPAFEVLGHYKEYGYHPNTSGLAVMYPDHIGLEFGFISLLFERLARGEYSKKLVSDIEEFLTYHILRWLPILYATLKLNFNYSIYTKILEGSMEVSVEALNYIRGIKL